MKSNTKSVENLVERHYGHAGIYESILRILSDAGVDTRDLKPEDLAPIDEFHVRGREGTVELASRIDWQPGMRVLDVGCGIGGSSRYLASTYNVQVTGIDLTHEFVDAAINLSELVGLDGTVRFHQGSAIDMPFRDESFDVVWTQHVQMNIEDKKNFYSEMARVLRPGGKMVFHDIFSNGDQQPHYPVPWADEPSYSFLTTPEKARRIVEGLGLEFVQWEDSTQKSLDWMIQMKEKASQANGPVLSPVVIIGETGKVKMENAARSLAENRLRVIQAVAQK